MIRHRHRQLPALRHLTLLLVALLSLPPPAGACVKTLRWNEDPPYSMRLADGSIAGVNIELHRSLLQRLGCKVELVEMPFARALTELQLGRLDLLPGAFDRPERRAFALFSQPLVQVRNLLYVRQGDLARTQGKSLANLVAEGWRLGVQIGVVYGQDYADLLKDPAAVAKLQSVPRRSSLWLMLDRGRVDAVPADELSAAHELGSLSLQGRIVASPLVLSTEGVGTAFNKRSHDEGFVQRFDAALLAMKADGSYAALLRRYGLDAAGTLPQ
jgi:polar amino acid transport system substrate-binding protein